MFLKGFRSEALMTGTPPSMDAAFTANNQKQTKTKTQKQEQTRKKETWVKTLNKMMSQLRRLTMTK